MHIGKMLLKLKLIFSWIIQQMQKKRIANLRVRMRINETWPCREPEIFDQWERSDERDKTLKWKKEKRKEKKTYPYRSLRSIRANPYTSPRVYDNSIRRMWKVFSYWSRDQKSRLVLSLSLPLAKIKTSLARRCESSIRKKKQAGWRARKTATLWVNGGGALTILNILKDKMDAKRSQMYSRRHLIKRTLSPCVLKSSLCQ